MSRLFSATAFAGVLLAFTLPFGMVSSCGGEEVRFTGVQLVTQDVPPDTSQQGTLHEDVEAAAGFFAIMAALAAAAGLAVAAAGRAGLGIAAGTGLVTIQLTGYGIVMTSDNAELFIGFWLALGMFATAGVIRLALDVQERRRPGESVWPAVGVGVGIAVSLLLPPVGLIVVALAWLVFVLARSAANGLRSLRTG